MTQDVFIFNPNTTTEEDLAEFLSPPKDDPSGCVSLISIETSVPGVDCDVKSFIESLETINLPFHTISSTILDFCDKGKMRAKMCNAFLDCITEYEQNAMGSAADEEDM